MKGLTTGEIFNHNHLLQRGEKNTENFGICFFSEEYGL